MAKHFALKNFEVHIGGDVINVAEGEEVPEAIMGPRLIEALKKTATISVKKPSIKKTKDVK